MRFSTTIVALLVLSAHAEINLDACTDAKPVSLHCHLFAKAHKDSQAAIELAELAAMRHEEKVTGQVKWAMGQEVYKRSFLLRPGCQRRYNEADASLQGQNRTPLVRGPVSRNPKRWVVSNLHVLCVSCFSAGQFGNYVAGQRAGWILSRKNSRVLRLGKMMP